MLEIFTQVGTAMVLDDEADRESVVKMMLKRVDDRTVQPSGPAPLEQALPLTRAWCLFEVLQTMIIRLTGSHAFAILVSYSMLGYLEQKNTAPSSTNFSDRDVVRRENFKGLYLCTTTGVLQKGAV